MLSKSEKKLLRKLTPTIEELLNKEALPVLFCYLDGDNIFAVGSDRAKRRMEAEVRKDQSWIRTFQKDEKEMLR